MGKSFWSVALLPSPPSPVASQFGSVHRSHFTGTGMAGRSVGDLSPFFPLSCWACSTIKALPNRSRRCDRIDQFQVQCMGSHVLHHRYRHRCDFHPLPRSFIGTEVPRSSLDSSSRFSSFLSSIKSDTSVRGSRKSPTWPSTVRRGRRGRRIERSSLRMSAETRSSNTPTIECFLFLSQFGFFHRTHSCTISRNALACVKDRQPHANALRLISTRKNGA